MAKPMKGQRWRPPGALQQQGWDAAAEEYRRRGELSKSPQLTLKNRETTQLKVKNTTGAARSQGDVVKLSGTPLTTMTAEHPWMSAIAPAASGNHGILKYAVASNGYVDCQLSGIVVARVDINDTADTHANVVASQYYLESSQSGPHKILHNIGGTTGVQDCLVLLGAGFDFGWDMVAYVPNGTSIAARSSTRVYSESLAMYYEVDDVSNPGERIITAMVDSGASAYYQDVYNFSNEAVTGPRYVMTSLTASGTRYVVLESCTSD